MTSPRRPVNRSSFSMFKRTETHCCVGTLRVGPNGDTVMNCVGSHGESSVGRTLLAVCNIEVMVGILAVENG